MSPASPWTATLLVQRPDPESAERLLAALAPEAAREVPRTQILLERDGPSSLRAQVVARDTGALRAGLNALLGWIALTERLESELSLEP
ncbi:MAG: hypothetical protein L3K04_04695 [Thermoplasmata archaeon]|nr:hypothetical protein [Thermoplasmata archaeon]